MERIRTKEGIKLLGGQEVTLVPQAEYILDLKEIKGIGEKTIKDILKVFPTFESLARADDYPFRDDIVEKLKEYVNKNG